MRTVFRFFAVVIVVSLCVAGVSIQAQENRVLRVWDINNREVESGIIDTLIVEFEAANPGVTVDRVSKSLDDLKVTTALALASEDGPDVVQVNQGLSDMGALVKAGLLLDLTDYAAQYGWVEKLSPGIVARNSFSADGVTFGEGNLYGVPPVAELIGVFYNKQIFADNGLSVPTTFGAFEQLMAALKEKDITPIVFGSLDGWPAIHTYSEIQNGLITREYLDDFVFGRSDVGFDTPENLAAAQSLRAWVEAGYFTPFFEGIGYDDSWRLFGEGQGAMMLTGSWISGELLKMAEPDAFGFFLTPPINEGDARLAVGGTSLAYAIRAATPDADLAAAYIEWMMSPRAAELWIAAGYVPVQPVDDALAPEDTLFGDLVRAWKQLNATDSVGHYLDWATPTFYSTITTALQELLGGQISPEDFVKRLNDDYQAYMAEKAG